MSTVLFLNHADQQCGIHKLGRYVATGLEKSSRHAFVYKEISTNEDVKFLIGQFNPSAIIINWHSDITMPHISLHEISSYGVPLIGILHEVSSRNIGEMIRCYNLFSGFIVHEPDLKTEDVRVLRTVRPVPQFINNSIEPAVLTVGSFGFATPSKRFPAIVHYVQTQVDECVIKFNIPSAKFGDPNGDSARSIADLCRSVVKKPGIKLDITHDFMSDDQILKFLSENSINIFFYAFEGGRGLSSAIDLALSSGRPLVLNKSYMFRHMFGVQPSIFAEDLSLVDILRNGTAPLNDIKLKWTMNNLVSDYENFIDFIVSGSRKYD